MTDTATAPSANGTAPSATAQALAPAAAPMTTTTTTTTGPRMPRRERWIDVPEYPGFRVKLWVNYPRRLQDDLKSGDAERLEGALRQLVVGHNDWCAEDGTPLPPSSTAEFWAAIPDELAAALLALMVREENVLPNSILAASRRGG